MELFLWHARQGHSLRIENVVLEDGVVTGTVREPVRIPFGTELKERTVSVGRWDPERPDVAGWLDRPVPAPDAPDPDPTARPLAETEPPPLYDPSELTVDELTVMLPDLTSLEDLAMVRSAEVGGKNRKTALEAIDSRIAAIEEELTRPAPEPE